MKDQKHGVLQMQVLVWSLLFKGALEGKEYGIANKDDNEALVKINDFEWLREQFSCQYEEKSY